MTHTTLIFEILNKKRGRQKAHGSHFGLLLYAYYTHTIRVVGQPTSDIWVGPWVGPVVANASTLSSCGCPGHLYLRFKIKTN